MNFESALKAMREGKAVKRKDWDCYYAYAKKIGIYSSYDSSVPRDYFYVVDILAEDWEILED